MTRFIVSITILALAPLALGAAATQASTAPTMQDLSSPIGSVVSFANALESGEMNKLKEVTIGTPEQYKLFTTTLAAASAARRLQDAAVERFGEDGHHCVRLPSDLTIDDFVQTIHGESAEVGGRGEQASLLFRKVGRVWKLDLNSMPTHRTKAETVEFDRRQTLRAEMYAGITVMVRSGQFATASELKRRILDSESLIDLSKENGQPPSK